MQNDNIMLSCPYDTCELYKSLDSSSIVMIGESKKEYTKIYIQTDFNLPYEFDSGYVKNAEYKLLEEPPISNIQVLALPEEEFYREYKVDKNGRCYFICTSGSKIYLKKSHYSEIINSARLLTSSQDSRNANVRISSNRVSVKGHYRKTKSGKLVYVKGHSRSK